jgi:flagellin
LEIVFRQLGLGGAAGAKSTERLSSGFRINKAGDDAAGLAISEKMRGQIRGLSQASSNAQDAISLIQTAEGALQETHSILQRMRELGVQSANDTNTTTDRNEIQKEVDQLTNELDRIANTTEFNTQKLLNGEKEGLRDAATGVVTVEANTAATITATPADSDDLDTSGTIIITRTSSADGDENDFTIGDPGALGAVLTNITTLSDAAFGDVLTLTGLADMQVGDSVTISIKANDDGNDDATKALTMQIGANSGQTVLIGINDMRAEALGLRDNNGKALDITNAQKATAAITTINNALETVSAERSKLGSMQNRLDHSIKNLDTSAENLQASESRIRDVDMAKEMMEFTKNNILQQAAQAMLAQANQAPQGVLQLLR